MGRNTKRGDNSNFFVGIGFLQESEAEANQCLEQPDQGTKIDEVLPRALAKIRAAQGSITPAVARHRQQTVGSLPRSSVNNCADHHAGNVGVKLSCCAPASTRQPRPHPPTVQSSAIPITGLSFILFLTSRFASWEILPVPISRPAQAAGFSRFTSAAPSRQSWRPLTSSPMCMQRDRYFLSLVKQPSSLT